MENRKTYSVTHPDFGTFTFKVVMQHDTWISGDVSQVKSLKPFANHKHPLGGFHTFPKASLTNNGEITE